MSYKPFAKAQGATYGGSATAPVDTTTQALVWYDTAAGTNTAAPTIVISAATAAAQTITFASTGDTDLPTTSGGTSGVITLNNSSSNTWGEVADLVNGTNYWNMTLMGVRRADIAQQKPIALSSTEVTETSPHAILGDALNTGSTGLQDANTRFWTGIGPEFDSDIGQANARRSKNNLPSGDRQPGALNTNRAYATVDTVSKLDWLTVFVSPDAGTATATVSVYSCSESEDSSAIWSVSGLADDTVHTYDADDFASVYSAPGERLVVTMESAHNQTSDECDGAHLSINGRYGPPEAF